MFKEACRIQSELNHLQSDPLSSFLNLGEFVFDYPVVILEKKIIQLYVDIWTEFLWQCEVCCACTQFLQILLANFLGCKFSDTRHTRYVVVNVDNLITGFHEVWFPSSRGFLPSLFRPLFVMFQLANTIPRSPVRKARKAQQSDRCCLLPGYGFLLGRQNGLLLSKVRIHLLLATSRLSRIHYFALPVGQAS
jgi:hypothetical protein